MFPQKKKHIKFHIPEQLLFFVPFTEVLHFPSHSYLVNFKIVLKPTFLPGGDKPRGASPGQDIQIVQYSIHNKMVQISMVKNVGGNWIEKRGERSADLQGKKSPQAT